ncbi:MAG: sodium:proton antiporter, partial [Deltaproteobacteria bacterium]|nr:sodium:proton antiporter [Deltaproteobacteria bacterium]
SRIDFDETLMHGMLGLLLFAGALHVDLGGLLEQKRVIGLLASAGLLISTAAVGGATWGLTQLLGLDLPFIVCLLYGALISPTDPIAVLALLKSSGAPRRLETKIVGESLFNDGIAVVFFLAIAGAAGFSAGGHGSGMEHGIALGVLELFALETLGGGLFGLAAGWLTYAMLRSVDSYEVEVLLSLALATGGYALAGALGVSGPIAMVIAGLVIGNHGRRFAMSERTREHLDTFWTLVDEILNAVLFVLIGLEVLIIPFDAHWLLPALAAVPIALGARAVAVGLPVQAMRTLREFTPHAVKVLTWGGLRGGISVALALSLKETLGEQQPRSYELVLLMTYNVVVFSILVQGLTMVPLLRRLGLSNS